VERIGKGKGVAVGSDNLEWVLTAVEDEDLVTVVSLHLVN
jgi:hypothetical protein